MKNITNKSKEICLQLMQSYQGKLTKELLIQMTLSLEKRAFEICEISPDYNLDALLIGIYFHDVGRTISDEDDHIQHSLDIFNEKIDSKKIDKEAYFIIEDCCLRHGSSEQPKTKEGKLLQILDKSVVFEPEVMMVVLSNIIKKNTSWKEAYTKFLKKMNKWYDKIPDEDEKIKHQKTLGYLNEVK